MTMRSSVINKYDRITGDSITQIVAKIMNQRPKLQPDEIYLVLEEFVNYQDLNPGKKINKVSHKKIQKIIKNISKIVREYREGL